MKSAIFEIIGLDKNGKPINTAKAIKTWLFIAVLVFITALSLRPAKADISTWTLTDWMWPGGKVVEAVTNKIGDVTTGESLLAPIIESAGDYIYGAVCDIGDSFFEAILKSFDPHFGAFTNSFSNLAQGGKLDASNTEADTSMSFFGISIIQNIFNAAKIIGISFATIIFLFNLLMLLFGRADQIKTNLISLIALYGLSMLIIANADRVIDGMSQTFGNIWEYSVMTAKVGGGDESLSFGQFFAIITFIMEMVKIPGVAAIVFFVALIILWKFVKNFLKMYMSIIEHYIAMTILMIFAPIVVPTMMVPTTNNVFKSYVRMMTSQFVCMVVTVLSMKLFVSILITGGWTAGIINYIAGLAFLKVGQNVDTYMSKMGLDIVAGAGNFMQSCKGAGMGLMNLLRTANMISNTGEKMFAKRASAALAKNDSATYMNNIGKTAAGAGMSDSQKQQAFVQAQLAKSKGVKTTYTSNANATALDQAYAHNMPDAYVKTLYDRYKNMSAQEIKTGIREVVNSNGMYAFKDNTGRVIATTNSQGEMSFNYPDRAEYRDLDSTEKATFLGSGSRGTDESYVIGSQEQFMERFSSVDNFNGFNQINANDIASDVGAIPEGVNVAQVDCGNGTHRNVVFGYEGSGFFSDYLSDGFTDLGTKDTTINGHSYKTHMYVGKAIRDKAEPKFDKGAEI